MINIYLKVFFIFIISLFFIKTEYDNYQAAEDIKPEILQKIKSESFVEKNEQKITIPQLNDEAIKQGNYSSSETNDTNVKSSEESDDELEILNKFNLMKNTLRRKGIYKEMTNIKFECEIAKKLGTNRSNIFKIKRKFQQIRKPRMEDEPTKLELIKKFEQMKKEKIYGNKIEKSERAKIEREITKDLGINRHQIYKWKTELTGTKKFSKDQRLEKIKQFEKIKEEILKKFKIRTTEKIEAKIAQKIDVGLSTIYLWKRQFGISTPKFKHYTKAEKMEVVKKFYKLKSRKVMMSDIKIADKLGVDRNSLRRWRKKFGSERQ